MAGKINDKVKKWYGPIPKCGELYKVESHMNLRSFAVSPAKARSNIAFLLRNAGFIEEARFVMICDMKEFSGPSPRFKWGLFQLGSKDSPIIEVTATSYLNAQKKISAKVGPKANYPCYIIQPINKIIEKNQKLGELQLTGLFG